MCHMSCVTCNIIIIYLYIFFLPFFLDKLVKLIDKESVINGVYPSSYQYTLNHFIIIKDNIIFGRLKTMGSVDNY